MDLWPTAGVQAAAHPARKRIIIKALVVGATAQAMKYKFTL